MSRLNPNEAPKGYRAKLAAGGKGLCHGCSFLKKDFYDNCRGCVPETRKDGCTVIFVPKKGKHVTPTPKKAKGPKATT